MSILLHEIFYLTLPLLQSQKVSPNPILYDSLGTSLQFIPSNAQTVALTNTAHTKALDNGVPLDANTYLPLPSLVACL